MGKLYGGNRPELFVSYIRDGVPDSFSIPFTGGSTSAALEPELTARGLAFVTYDDGTTAMEDQTGATRIEIVPTVPAVNLSSDLFTIFTFTGDIFDTEQGVVPPTPEPDPEPEPEPEPDPDAEPAPEAPANTTNQRFIY